MTHSVLRRTLSLSAYGLLAVALFWAGGIAAVSQREKPSEPESEPTIQPSSTTQDTSSTCSKTGMSEHQIPDTPQDRQRARKMVARQSGSPEEEYAFLEHLGLL